MIHRDEAHVGSGGQLSGYRASHLDKGRDYDRELSESAFDRYMTKCERSGI